MNVKKVKCEEQFDKSLANSAQIITIFFRLNK